MCGGLVHAEYGMVARAFLPWSCWDDCLPLCLVTGPYTRLGRLGRSGCNAPAGGGLKATEAAQRIRTVEGYDKISDKQTDQNWFKYFKEEDLIFEIKVRSGRPATVNLEELKRNIEVNPASSPRKLVEKLGH
ncbi:hypothetical protein AVEN_12700-1 [Araneus ventricosus]|uniref:Mos1 transposase HTH domain-containing protein n=1 Tax=Araneus ventricosus TaxID=182803 RepID=A0A4Y2ABG9_ARAVE|nr:hypothetical protein AVEN_12700-1 [Araneus ventricosus]